MSCLYDLIEGSESTRESGGMERYSVLSRESGGS
jgi:hypothetical protein